ncbi:MAG TPA: hypothetical protein VFP82_06160, partial [Chthoniobacterales bacterium]|nr:hypothetical protein [Chthoniobacterales bacterium]
MLDKSEHGVELALEMFDFILGHGDAGEMRNAANGIGVDGHGISGGVSIPSAYSREAFIATTG